MTSPPLDPATFAGDEPLCADCSRRQGLCAYHEKYELPGLDVRQLRAIYGMIGDCYVCDRPECADHAKCIDVPGHSAPRAECGCHNCSQRRWARARAAELDEPSAATLKAQRRNERKHKKRSAAERLAHGMRGGFSRSTRSRSAA